MQGQRKGALLFQHVPERHGQESGSSDRALEASQRITFSPDSKASHRAKCESTKRITDDTTARNSAEGNRY